MKLLLKRLYNKLYKEPLPTGLTEIQRDLIRRLKARRLTYLSNKKLALIAKTCMELEQANTAGSFVEAGCALGGSSILIASEKNKKRSFYVYDVFGMIPPPSEKDTPDVHDRYEIIASGKSKGLAGDKYYGYQENLYEIVKSNLLSFGIDCKERSVNLIKGLVQDTMKIDAPVAFAHIDVDWYDPVMVCLQRIYPNLVAGGSIILDDYHDWGGCRKATDEFLEGVKNEVVTDDSAGSMKITRINPIA